jgi:Protein of unknown function (DUF1501)
VKRLIETPMSLTRRDLLLKTVFGAGFLGLRALATGLPISFLANPRKALAGISGGDPPPACATNPNAQYLILATSGGGDPVNANLPGTYNVGGSGPKILHPSAWQTGTSLSLGSVKTTAAAPWAALPQGMLNQTCVFHHGTYTLVHADEPQVMSLMGSANDMLVSLIAKQLASCLGTIQTQPVALGPEEVSFGGQPLPNLPPTALATMLASETGPLANLITMRDNDLRSIEALIKADGNSAQQAFVDSYATSRDEVRMLSQSLIGQLGALKDNTQASQLQAALILIQMNVAPVMVVHLDFGGDNHSDTGLATEMTNTESTLANLGTFWQQLQTTGTGNQISMATLNVFGRTLATNGSSTITSADGRNHNPNLHSMVMIGAPFAGSIIGGVEPVSASTQNGLIPSPDYAAMSIDPSTGAGVPAGGGAVQFDETFQSAALTLATGLGVSASYLADNIIGGQVIPAALAS